MMKIKPTYGDQPVGEFFHPSRGFPKAVSDIAAKLKPQTEVIPVGTYFEQFGDTTVISLVEETNPKEIWLSIISTCLSVYGNAFSAYCCQVSNLRVSQQQTIPQETDRKLFDEYCDADILVIVDDRINVTDSKTDYADQAILNKLVHKRSCSPGTITLLVGDHWKKCKPYENYKAIIELKRGLLN